MGSLILAIGAEGPGVSNQVLAQADVRVSIHLAGKVESLNSTVAGAMRSTTRPKRDPLA